MLTQDEVRERLDVQNVGDLERVVRTGAGAAIVLAGSVGAEESCGGRCGWPAACSRSPALRAGVLDTTARGVTSIDGPGDRPDEALRAAWLEPRVVTRRDATLEALAEARHADPFGVLGPHVERGASSIRAMPADGGSRHGPAQRIGPGRR